MNTLSLYNCAAFFAFILLAFYAYSVNAANSSGNATGEIAQSITLSENIAMDFAIISPIPAGDRIILTADNRTVSFNGSALAGAPKSAEFTVTGIPNSAVSLSFSITNSLSGPGQDITLQSFRHDVGTTPSLDANGILDINLGADLMINANQANGTYTGTYQMTVDYL